MRTRIPQQWLEWGFVGLMAVLCALLSVFQYRWIGEVSEAQQVSLERRLEDRMQRAARELDASWNEQIGLLQPNATGGERLELRNRAAIVKWREGRHGGAPIRRAGYAVPEGDRLRLHLWDEKDGLVEREWPTEWAGLRDELRARYFENGRPPGPRKGTPGLIEAPVFGPAGRELEWVIVEADLKATEGDWVKMTLGADWAEFDFRVEERTGNAAGRVGILNPQRGGPRGSRLQLVAKPKSGSLPGLITAARRKNLLASLGIVALLFVSGLALVRQTRKARQAAEAQMKFVAGVSHELRTPLTVIVGAGHNLLSGVVREPKQVERYARMIVTHGQQLSGMIEQVLDFSRGKQRIAPRETLRLAGLIESALEAVSHEVARAECEVELEIDAGLPGVVGDANELQRAFQNLIVNAAKHGGEGRWIGVTAKETREGERRMVEVRVADRGPGIAEEELRHLFDPFFRGERARLDQVRGTGLGLSLLKEIAEVHGGTVSARNLASGGAEFVVRLPAVGEESEYEFSHPVG